MPYKEKLKNSSMKPRKKPEYKVTRWTEYNKILYIAPSIPSFMPTSGK
jgi:hypothetical protein